MANAAARVLELFLETPTRGVTGVTHVTGRSVTPKNQLQRLRRLRTKHGNSEKMAQSAHNRAIQSNRTAALRNALRSSSLTAVRHGIGPRCWRIPCYRPALCHLPPEKHDVALLG